ncbi:hypothetical protein MK489_25160, partial [Myxococcota bacterium]|nr:hypothetical protein [Myxococcota bacterium]
MTPHQSRKRSLCFVLATLGYVAVSLFVLRNVLPDPVQLLPYNSGIDEANRKIGHLDQSMVISVITRNADLLLTEPWNLLRDGQCFPFPQSYTLGEHMFGEGVQMAIPWLLTGDPILSYNLLLIFTLCMPGIAMYLLAEHFTRHAGASFLAGLFLVLAPPRIIDGGHPYLHAEFWLPLILLFLDKLFREDKPWKNAAWLCLFLCLQALETIYVVAGCAIVTGAFGLHLLIRFRSRIPRVLLPLGTSIAIALALAWTVLGPYFETRETWDVLAGRHTALFNLTTFWYGTPYFIGTFALVFTTIGLLDRFLRPPPFQRADPRLAMLGAGLLVMWLAIREIPLPGTEVTIPGLHPILSTFIPGLDAARAFFAVTIALWVPVALLCGYGALALLKNQRTTATVVATALASLLLGTERFVPGLVSWNFGGTLDLGAWEGRPASDDIELIRAIQDGPTFDIPIPAPAHLLKKMAVSRHLLLQSWNPKP